MKPPPPSEPPRAIRITPGLTITPAPLNALSPYGVIEWITHKDGRYEARLIEGSEWLSLSAYPAEQLGIRISRKTILRLGTAGFLRLRRPTPDVIQFCLPDLIRHLEECEDPEFWSKENMQKYREAL